MRLGEVAGGGGKVNGNKVDVRYICRSCLMEMIME